MILEKHFLSLVSLKKTLKLSKNSDNVKDHNRNDDDDDNCKSHENDGN